VVIPVVFVGFRISQLRSSICHRQSVIRLPEEAPNFFLILLEKVSFFSQSPATAMFLS